MWFSYTVNSYTSHTFSTEYSPCDNPHFHIMTHQTAHVKGKTRRVINEATDQLQWIFTPLVSAFAGHDQRGRCGHQRRLLQGRGAAAVNLHRTEPEEAPGWGALNFDYTGLWTALRCWCTGGTSLDFTCFRIFCSHLRFSPLTLTPVTPSGKTETQAACSGCLWPCTGKSTRIKGCEWCPLLHFSAVQISEGSPEWWSHVNGRNQNWPHVWIYLCHSEAWCQKWHQFLKVGTRCLCPLCAYLCSSLTFQSLSVARWI